MKGNVVMIGIYKITCLINQKVYIGQSILLNKRLNSHFSHLKRGVHHNAHLQNAFNKYGEENFVIEILTKCNEEELDNLERYFISIYNSMNKNFGFNLMNGGQDSRRYFTQEVKDKMSKSNKGRIFSDEHKKHISLSQKGKTISAESIAKCIATKKLNQSHVGEKNANAIISNEKAKSIIEYLLLGHGVIETTNEFSVSKNVINNLIQNRSYTNILKPQREYLKNMYNQSFKDKVDKCVEMYLSGMSQNEIAKKMNVSRNSLRRELINKNIDTQHHINQFIYVNTEICKHITQGCLTS